MRCYIFYNSVSWMDTGVPTVIFQAAHERVGVGELISASSTESLRLDGSKKEFDDRWGYGALEAIRESSPLKALGKSHLSLWFFRLSDNFPPQ